MIFDAKLSTKFWAKACNMAAYLMNRTPRVLLGNRTPEEKWSGVKPDVSELKIFGSKVMVHVPKQKRTKWEPKSETMIFVGFDDNKKGFRCYNEKTKKVIVSRDIIFFESSFQTVKADLSNDVLANTSQEPSNFDANADTDDERMEDTTTDDFVTPNASNSEDNADDNIDLDDAVQDVQMDNEKGDVSNDLEETIRANTPAEDDDTSTDVDDPNDSNYKTRAKIVSSSTPRASKREKKQVRPFQVTHLALLSIEPQNFKDATESEDAKHWKEAMKEEIDSHKTNNTWTLTSLPPNRKAIGAKWVFKVKVDGNNGNKRFKARLVAKGFVQKQGIDFTETFSPVVRLNTIRILMALAVENNMKIHQMDAVTAFLQGDIKEELYMQQPVGFEDGTNRVCKLNKAIYGLRQAGRQWNKKLDAFLIEIGFMRSLSDPCVYVKNKLIIAIYVDDFLIFYSNLDELNTKQIARKIQHERHWQGEILFGYCHKSIGRLY